MGNREGTKQSLCGITRPLQALYPLELNDNEEKETLTQIKSEEDFVIDSIEVESSHLVLILST